MNSELSRRQFLRTGAAATFAAAAVPSVFAADKPIVIAFVGCAHIHTPGFVNLVKGRSDVKVKAVWDHDLARAEKRAKDLGAPVVKETRDIWADPEIAAVIICSETNLHHDLVLAAARAGKHVFAEKPLGINGKESLEMSSALEKSGVLFTTGYFTRTDPKYLFLKDEIAKGAFGTITRVRASNCHEGSLGGWFDTEWRWMADPKVAGVGGFGDLGTHKLDILIWMFGDIDSVTADIKAVTRHYGDCDESGEALIRFKSGVTGTLAAGWVDIDDPVPFLVSGTEAHATIINNQLFYKSKKVAGADGKQPYTKMPPAAKAPLHQFLDAVGGAKDQPLVTPREAAARVVAMEAMYRAAKKHDWVKVA